MVKRSYLNIYDVSILGDIVVGKHAAHGWFGLWLTGILRGAINMITMGMDQSVSFCFYFILCYPQNSDTKKKKNEKSKSQEDALHPTHFSHSILNRWSSPRSDFQAGPTGPGLRGLCSLHPVAEDVSDLFQALVLQKLPKKARSDSWGSPLKPKKGQGASEVNVEIEWNRATFDV